MRFLSFSFLFLVVCFFGCKNNSKHSMSSLKLDNSIAIKHAQGFEITQAENYKILTIKSPWQNSTKIFRYALVNESDISEYNFNQNDFDGLLKVPIKTIVVTSTTHIPSLELLNVQNTLVAFPETDYISSEITRNRIDKGYVRDLGKNEGINIEVLLELKPDVVIGFGVDGVNKAFENINKANIPVVYNGDWVESSPLAKAEWVKFFGVLYGVEKKSDSIFNAIESDYLEAKELASTVQDIPTVLSGAMHKDIWYLPNGASTEAQFLKDANVNYLWSNTKGTGSLALNFEVVFDRAKDADIWMSPSYYKSYEDLKQANQHYSKFKAYANQKVFSFNNTKGKSGGVLYYELGFARPDIVLKDIIKICHPELLKNYEPFFFKPLE
ncbi:MAG: ABC transporter substrate-binding protein [Flavobacteriaceae bacterium]|nr:ABC transporter substrate-binding protein [Bacteroidia bacterium]NNL16962.1 ABC transporter substrate-binding protein [Flavobacteriaceae bacterium]